MTTKYTTRSHPRYGKNPFVKGLYAMKRGKKTVAIASKDYGLYDKGTGEIQLEENQRLRGFIGMQRIVDKDEFVKIFLGGLAKYLELSQLGQTVLTFLFHAAKIGDDRILFEVRACMEFIKRSEATCWRGIGELLNKEFIARTETANVYYINVNLFYKGDRYTLFDDVILRGSKEAERVEKEQEKNLENMKQMDLFPHSFVPIEPAEEEKKE